MKNVRLQSEQLRRKTILADEERNKLFESMKGVVKKIAPSQSMKQYMLTEMEAVCEKSNDPYDNVASIFISAVADLLYASREMVSLGNAKRNVNSK